MDVPEKSPRAPAPPASGRPLPGSTTVSRRTLHRVKTTALDVRTSVRVDDVLSRGHLLNISAGGCSVRVPLPLTLELDTGVAFDVILPGGASELICSGKLVGLDMGHGSAILRLSFRVLTPETRRALLSLIGELVTRDFQLRHMAGNCQRSSPNTL